VFCDTEAAQSFVVAGPPCPWPPSAGLSNSSVDEAKRVVAVRRQLRTFDDVERKPLRSRMERNLESITNTSHSVDGELSSGFRFEQYRLDIAGGVAELPEAEKVLERAGYVPGAKDPPT
jgi:hypothetical protein